MEANFLIVEGLKKLAQEQGTTVIEAAMLGILAEWPVGGAPPDLDDIGDIIDALREFKVEDTYLYTQGLLNGAGLGVTARNTAIWESTHRLMLNMQDHKAYEHLTPLKNAHLSLTGKRFSRTP